RVTSPATHGPDRSLPVARSDAGLPTAPHRDRVEYSSRPLRLRPAGTACVRTGYVLCDAEPLPTSVQPPRPPGGVGTGDHWGQTGVGCLAGTRQTPRRHTVDSPIRHMQYLTLLLLLVISCVFHFTEQVKALPNQLAFLPEGLSGIVLLYVV